MCRHTPVLLSIAIFLPLAACAGPHAPEPALHPGAARPTMVAHKTATCGCVCVWIDHVREAGFGVK